MTDLLIFILIHKYARMLDLPNPTTVFTPLYFLSSSLDVFFFHSLFIPIFSFAHLLPLLNVTPSC